tara:strand:- start:311 stop:493 length:183 start_codon:yes stop_codon:yes gene_type:complete
MLVSSTMKITKSDLIKRIQTNKSRSISVYDIIDSTMLKKLMSELNNGMKKNGYSVVVLEV